MKTRSPSRYISWLRLPMLWLAPAAPRLPRTAKALVSALRAGGYVILMRHASSCFPLPGTAAHADNLKRERQLDESGREAARLMGGALRSLKIPVGQVLSSPTYRALETLRLAQLGPAQTYTELGAAGESKQDDHSLDRVGWLRARAGMQPPSGTNTLIVTHHPNLTYTFPQDRALDDGEALILRPDGHGGVTLVARVQIHEWAQLLNV